MKLNYYAIQKNINEWDPMGIMCGYFDEYEREVDMIFDKCDYVKKNDIVGLAKVIAEVFDKQFDGNFYESDCFKVAQKIFDDSHKF